MILIPQLPGASLDILLSLMSFVHIGAFGTFCNWIDCAPATSFLTIDLTLSLLGQFSVWDKSTPHHMSTLPFSRPRTLSAPVFIVTRAPGSSGRSRGTRTFNAPVFIVTRVPCSFSGSRGTRTCVYCRASLADAPELPAPAPVLAAVFLIIPNRTNIGKR